MRVKAIVSVVFFGLIASASPQHGHCQALEDGFVFPTREFGNFAIPNCDFGEQCAADSATSRHTGVDYRTGQIDSYEGSYIFAAAFGEFQSRTPCSEVSSSNPNNQHNFGNVVVIKHLTNSAEELYSMYAHMTEDGFAITEGKRFFAGREIIGIQGRTGMDFEPIRQCNETRWPKHLHFEIRGFPEHCYGSGYGIVCGYTSDSIDPLTLGYLDPEAVIDSEDYEILLPRFSANGQYSDDDLMLYAHSAIMNERPRSLYAKLAFDLDQETEFERIYTAGFKLSGGEPIINEQFYLNQGNLCDRPVVLDAGPTDVECYRSDLPDGDYLFKAYFRRDGRHFEGYPVVFRLLSHDDAHIVDNLSASGFSAIGITDYADNDDDQDNYDTRDQYIPGYGYDARLIPGDSAKAARFSVAAPGLYHVSAFIPKGGTAKNARFTIRPQGDGGPAIYSQEIDLSQRTSAFGFWANLHAAGDRLKFAWPFTADGYVAVEGDPNRYGPEDKLVVDAVLFSPASRDCPVFPDIDPDDWFYWYVERLYREHIFDGYPDGTFKPSTSMNKAEFLKTVLEASPASPALFSVFPAQAPYEDVPAEAWFAPYVEYAKNNDIIVTCGPSNFCPDDDITRAEAVEILVKAFPRLKDKYDELVANPAELTTEFTDLTDDSLDIYYYAHACREAGVLSGYEEGDFRAGNSINRAEVAKIVGYAKHTRENMAKYENERR